MKKLQRYRNVLESEMYFASEVDSVISALEAENERLRKYAFHNPDCERWGYEGKMFGIMDGNSYNECEPCTCGLEALLNREQEKP